MMSYHKSTLPDLIAGARKVIASKQYGSVVYIFQLPNGELMMTTREASGVGKLIHTERGEAAPAPGPAFDAKIHGDAPIYDVLYEGTSKP